MPRMTLNIDAPILRDLRRLQRQEGKPLGRLVSDLLTQVLRQDRSGQQAAGKFRWVSRPMGARVDLADTEALRALLDRENHRRRSRRRP